MILDNFPDVYRYGRIEAGRTRLIAGFITINIICFVMYLVFSAKSEGREGFFYFMLGMQGLMILVFSILRSADSIARERAEKTWDFQRLTPLTSFEITLGKVIGAPVFAYFLFAVILPWTLFAFFVDQSMYGSALIFSYSLMATTFFLLLGIAIMISAFTQGTNTVLAGGGGAIVGLLGFGVWLEYLFKTSHSTVMFYTVPCDDTWFLMISQIAFGLWAFVCAQWRVGQDLLERRAVWRFPVFLLFLFWYMAGLTSHITSNNPNDVIALSCLMLPTAFVYAGAFLNVSGYDVWRRWLSRGRDVRVFTDMPVWVTGFVTVVCIAVLMAFMFPIDIYRNLVIVPAFLGRDLLFLQWCRFSKARRRETMAITYLTIAYVLPMFLFAGLQLDDQLYLVEPVLEQKVGFVQNVLPGLIQLTVMGWMTYRKFMKPLV